MTERQILGRRLAGIALFVCATGASVIAGEPPGGELPDVSLGWPILLYLERAAVAVGILGFTVLIIWRAGRGEFPVRFGNVEYEARSVASQMDEGIEVLELRIEQLEKKAEQGV
ncbi:MAG: hypothetical protein U0R51_08785 [Solirubrobacterales bacterium]